MDEIKVNINDIVRCTDDINLSVKPNKVYGSDSWFITIRLTDFIDSSYESIVDDNTGEVVEGVFIPIKKNGIFISPKKNAIVNMKASVSQVPSSKYSHIIEPIMDTEEYEEISRLGYKKPIVGFMKTEHFKTKSKKYVKNR